MTRRRKLTALGIVAAALLMSAALVGLAVHFDDPAAVRALRVGMSADVVVATVGRPWDEERVNRPTRMVVRTWHLHNGRALVVLFDGDHVGAWFVRDAQPGPLRELLYRLGL